MNLVVLPSIFPLDRHGLDNSSLSLLIRFLFPRFAHALSLPLSHTHTNTHRVVVIPPKYYSATRHRPQPDHDRGGDLRHPLEGERMRRVRVRRIRRRRSNRRAQGSAEGPLGSVGEYHERRRPPPGRECRGG